jgi:PAS domain S-box-containing protein
MINQIDFHNNQKDTDSGTALEQHAGQTLISKQKEYENVLFKHEQEFRSLVENSVDIITRYNSNLQRVYANPAYYKFAGFTEAEALNVGLKQKTPLPASVSESLKNLLEQVFKTGSPGEMDMEWTHPVNGYVCFSLRAVPEFDKTGNVESVMSIARDITIRKETERQLKETQNRLSTILSTIPDLVWLKDVNGVYLGCNKAFEGFFGATEAEITGKTDYDFVDAELAGFFRTKDMEAIAAEKVCINEETITYASNGKMGLLETRKVPVYDANGQIAGVLGIARDITERKNAETLLAGRESELRTLTENIPDPIFRYNRQCQRIYVNPVVCRILGKPAKDLISKTPLDAAIVGAEQNQEIIQVITSIFNDGQPRKLDVVFTDPDGKHFDFNFCLTPEYGNDGSIETVLGIGRDITERKNVELALAESEKKVRQKLEAVLSPDMNFSSIELSDIIDIEKIQPLAKAFSNLTGISLGIIGSDGKIIVKDDWQDVCTKFHRANPKSCQMCTYSAADLCEYVPIGTFKKYRCKNNMWNIITPIVVGDKHMGNIFVGQFFYDDEAPENEIFVKQAEKYGYNIEQYFEALKRIPRVSHEKIDSVLSVLTVFAGMLANLSYSNLKLANLLEKSKILEAELKNKQSNLEEAQRIGRIGSWEMDSKTGKLEWSPELYRIFEIDPVSFSPSCEAFKQVIHPDDREMVTQAFATAEETKTSLDVDYRLLFPDGRIKYISGHTITSYNEKGQPTKAIGTVRDMTRRKEAELELLKAKEKAEESDRLKAAFLATMNHELRTPLNHILGFAELLKLGPEQAFEYAQNIQNSGQHLLNIIEDIFKLAMADQSGIILRNQFFSLNNLYSQGKQSLTEILENSEKSQNIKLIFKPDLSILSKNVSADLNKINQVLGNLFKNAVKFTQSGDIEFGMMFNQPGWLTLYVRDTGIGIQADKQHVIFDFFRQADDSNSRTHEGIGIGLAISKKITEILNGTLTFVSEQGNGSTFYFSIPVELEPEVLNNTRLSALPSSYEPRTSVYRN